MLQAIRPSLRMSLDFSARISEKRNTNLKQALDLLDTFLVGQE